jgi:hypothetical protein
MKDMPTWRVNYLKYYLFLTPALAPMVHNSADLTWKLV